ncbi:MAG: hypothetical protein ACLS3C_02620, partial [Oscillospiraceae bacterium]
MQTRSSPFCWRFCTYEINSRHAIKAFQTVIFLPFIVSWVAASCAKLYANPADVSGGIVRRNGIPTFFGEKKRF